MSINTILVHKKASKEKHVLKSQKKKILTWLNLKCLLYKLKLTFGKQSIVASISVFQREHTYYWQLYILNFFMNSECHSNTKRLKTKWKFNLNHDEQQMIIIPIFLGAMVTNSNNRTATYQLKMSLKHDILIRDFIKT